MINAEGMRLIDLSCIKDSLRQIWKCNCGSKQFDLKEDLSQSDCLYSALFFVCSSCGFRVLFPTSFRAVNTDSPAWDVNMRTMKIIFDLHIEQKVLENIFKYYNIPFVNVVSKDPEAYTAYNCESDRNSLSESDSSENCADSVSGMNKKQNFKVQPDVASEEQVDVQNLSRCIFCGATFSSLKFLELHKQECSSKLSECSTVGILHKCLQCKKLFENLETLREHSKQHSVYHCFKCSCNFESDFELKNHQKAHCQNQKECSICGKHFRKKCNLIQHTRRHAGEKPYLCSVCGKSFSDSSTLSKHQKGMHSSDRTLQCNICKKTFYHSGHLREHMRSHSGEKPFTCPECNKSFVHAVSLKKHSVVHSGQCKFKCTLCSRAFKWRESLKQHVKTHGQKKIMSEGEWNNLEAGMPVIRNALSSVSEPNSSSVINAPVTTSVNTDVSLTHVISYMDSSDVGYY